MTSRANDRQVAGDHYKRFTIEPWDFIAANRLDAFQGSIIRYVCRWDGKDGVQALHKARHYLDKYIEIIEHGYPNTAPEYFARMLEKAKAADVHNAAMSQTILEAALAAVDADVLAAELQHLEDEQLAEPDRERIDPAAMCRSRLYHRWERVNGETECEDCGEKMVAALAPSAPCTKHRWLVTPGAPIKCTLCGVLWTKDAPKPWAPVDEPDSD